VRVKAFGDYLDFSKINKIFDIGGGPGDISVKILPFVGYLGLDSGEKVVPLADARFGSPKRWFYDRLFNPPSSSAIPISS